jgi:uncharacterized membrane protein YfcA
MYSGFTVFAPEVGLMPVTSVIIAAFAILAASTAFSMVGIGGGVIYVPILLALGMNIHDAATTSLFVIMGMSVSAFVRYSRRSYVDWKLALVIEPPTFVMALVGGLVANYIDALALEMVFAAALVLVSFFMVRNIVEKEGVPVRRWGYWTRNLGDSTYTVRLPWLMPATTIAGFMAGMIGISGGVFKVPAMILLGNVPVRIAIGTSSLMVGFTALAGLCGHIIGGSFDILIALPLAVAAFVGGWFGSKLSVQARTGILRRFFAVLLLLIAIWLIVSELVGNL